MNSQQNERPLLRRRSSGSSRGGSHRTLIFWALVISFSFNLVALVRQGWWVVTLNWLGAETAGNTHLSLNKVQANAEVFTLSSTKDGVVHLRKIPRVDTSSQEKTTASDGDDDGLVDLDNRLETSPLATDRFGLADRSDNDEVEESDPLVATAFSKDALCDDERKMTQGTFVGHEFVFSGTCAAQGVSKWYGSKQEACGLLDGFDIHIIGQSTERRVYYALQAIAAGNPWAFKNNIAEEPTQHLKDQKGPLKNLERKPIPCLHIKLEFETSFGGIAKAVERIAKRAKKPASSRRTVVMFQFGLYGLADNNFHPKELTKQIDHFLTTSGVAQAARESGTILMWRPPVPVNATHRRFRRYVNEEKGWDANSALDRFRKLSSEVAHQHGVCIFDSFDAILSGVNAGAIEFETGLEWTPPQFGGIHLKDNGRKLVSQMFLNTLAFCSSQRR